MLGALPTGAARADYFIQTSVDKQVNLINTHGLMLNHWDGNAGPKNNNRVNGGAGVWVAPGGVNDNWTDSTGSVNAAWDQDAFAIFSGQSGTVRLDSTTNGQINVQSMQFAVDGYVLQGQRGGDKLTLKGLVTGNGPNEAAIRVGDRTVAGANYSATVSTVLDGLAKVVKTDRGTLTLGGVNTYAGGTAVNGGTLQVSRDENLGALAGALSLDEGTLATTASFDTARAITLGGGDGSINVAAGASLGVTSAISGSGALNKASAGTLVLHAANGYFRGTTITAGTLQLGAGGTTGSILGNVANNGTLAFNRSNNHTFGGLISGSGGVTQLGSGITVLTATNTYTGSTTITGGTLQLGAGGATGSITGNVTNNGSLIFNRGNAYTLDGVISGTGSVTQQGVGATALSGANSYGRDHRQRRRPVRERRPDRRHRRHHRQQQRQAGRQGRDWRRRDADGQQHAVARRQRPRARHADDQGQSGAGQRHGAELLVRPGQCGRGPLNDLVQVAGDVSLGGKLSVALSPGGRLNVGIYRVINYGGALSNPAALTLGTLPTGADRADYFIQTSVDKQVNLAYTNGLKLNYWDGGAGPGTTAMSMAAPVSGWRQAASTTAGPIPPARSMRPGARTPSRFSPARAARFWSIAPPMGRSTRKPCSSPSTAMSCRATGLETS